MRYEVTLIDLPVPILRKQAIRKSLPQPDGKFRQTESHLDSGPRIGR